MKTQCVRIFVIFWSLTFWCSTVFAQQSERIKVSKVVIEGNQVFDDDRLLGLMLTVPSGFLRKSYYYQEVFEDDLSNLTAFYRQNGYLDAAVIDTTVTIDSIKAAAVIEIVIDEGEPTIIEGITVFDNAFFDDEYLRKFIKLDVGDPLQRNIIQDGVLKILSEYAENGYLDAAVTPNIRINDSANLAVIDLMVREGAAARISDIRIEGLKRTDPDVVNREFKFHQEEIIRYSKLLNTQKRLYLTGLFESVFVRPVESGGQKAGHKDILVELKEKPSSEFGVMVGYGSVEKIRGRIELSSINLAGTGRQAGTSIEANFIKQGMTASFSEPWTLGTRWRTDINLFFELKNEPGFDSRGLGTHITLGRTIGYHTNISLTYRFENTTLMNVERTADVEEFDPRVRSLVMSFSHDTRNNLFDTHSGRYLAWANELAGSFLHGSNTFARSVMEGKWFRTLGKQMVLGVAFEIGWMDYFSTSDEIPLNERFYTGGPVSIRGFGYQLVGPRNQDGDPKGGKFKLVVHPFEIRQPLYKYFGVAVFTDAGNIWSSITDFDLRHLRPSVGTGLRVFTPLGIVRLDYSINLDRLPGEPRTKLYLAMGQAF